MNFFKRGLLNITRKKGKSIILLAIILILGNLIAGAISIQQATDNVETTIKERMGTAATLELDYDAISNMSDSEMMEFEFSPLDLDLIKQVGELDYVKYYDFSTSTYLGSESLDSYQGEGMEDHGYYQDEFNMNFRLKGTNYAPIIDFEEGESQLVDGRVFTEEELENGSSVAIISKKLADLNNLHVGDNFMLTNVVFDYSEGQEEVYNSRDVPLEIIGIFEPLSVGESDEESSEQGMWDFMDIELQNTVYVSNDTVLSELRYNTEQYMEMDEEYAAAMEGEEHQDHYTPIYILNSSDDASAFAEEVQPLLPELYVVRNVSDHFENIAGPIQSMSTLSNYVLIVSIVASVLIIGLVVLLFLRDRKHELGIYLSLGERRGKVVGQVLIEVMIVAFIGITLSLFSGNLLADGVSDMMMQSDNQNQGFDDMAYYGELQSDLTTEDVLESYQVQLDPSYIVMFFAVGLFTILLSTVIPLVYIVRLNPKKILM
ncbi:ABC transporter permease [Evansella halocellulosilytica]|uniref:ABC transporter permease n=1 Tax=Evansella halocellulosilytica TaxID=2011013 RepID=UPI000BB92A5E|nr:ABC transporter permease [Evansella halocellulosilytica]